MGHIIAGRFDVHESAERAADALRDAGFEAGSLSVFYVNPHGQHGTNPLGGDEQASPGARDSGKGAWVGAGAGAAAGAAVGSVAGPVGAAVGSGVGAYTGSLAGAVKSTGDASEVDDAADKTDEPESHFTERKSGMHLAVRVKDMERDQAIDILRRHQAGDLEQAEGTLRGGEWVDFDPTRAVRLV